MNLQEKEDIAKSLDALKKSHFDQVLKVKLAVTKTNLNKDADSKKKLKAWLSAWDVLITDIADKSL